MPLTSGKMRAEHEQKIRKNIKALKKDIEAKDLIDTFIEAGLFDFPDRDKITGYNPNTQDNRNNAFFSLMFQSGPRAYETFLKALRDVGQDFLADRVENTVLTGATEVVADGEWMASIPPATRSRRLLERDLSKLAQCLGRDWSLVLVEMGLSQADIDHSMMEHPNVPTMQIYAALNRWRMRENHNATLESFVKFASESPAESVDWASLKRVAQTL